MSVSNRKEMVRSHWQSVVNDVNPIGFNDTVIENIIDDDHKYRLCWCCGRSGHQEICHIMPKSLGGADNPENLFLLCGECHFVSPDTTNRCVFYDWINEHATTSFDFMIGIASKAMQGRRVTHNDGNEILIKAELEKSMRSAGTHKYYFNKSTIEWILTNSIEAITEPN